MWTWRYISIFDDEFHRPMIQTHEIIKMAKEIERWKVHHLTGRPQQMDIVFVGWKRVREWWIKLNSDNAHKSLINLSECGGLLREINVMPYMLWCGGMYMGIVVAHQKGITHLQVENNNKVLVEMLNGYCIINGDIPTLILHIRELWNMDWQV